MSIQLVVVRYVFAWHCLSDACPKCQRLDGQEFHDQDLFQDVLWSPIWGDIWDLNVDLSLTHPNCRCQLEVRVTDVTFHVDEFQELQNLCERCGITL